MRATNFPFFRMVAGDYKHNTDTNYVGDSDKLTAVRVQSNKLSIFQIFFFGKFATLYMYFSKK